MQLPLMDKQRPYLTVILIQAIYAGMFLLSKAAFNGGMNNFVFIFYRQAFATLFVAPISLAVEWKKAPPLSFLTFCKIFFLSLIGITFSLDLYGIALIYTSATLAAATTNCLPAITFFLAVLLRMEVLKLKTVPGVAKLVGILICIGGAATLAFYNGPQLRLLCHHHIFGHHNSQQIHGHVSSGKTWIKGCFIMLSSNTSFGLWLVLQGIIVTALTYYLQAWVIEKKGPVFLAMSTPLALIFTTIASVFLLCEIITLGRILGGLLLIGGLYAVLWGKSKEQKMVDKSCLPTQVDQKVMNSDQIKVMAAKSPSSPMFL
ncbi:WAT1-related protein [Citrus sinensis]|uniref:WAT1-related protein n=1 Tax=Citrus sinensis TaxID=2711 RepID=A0ACB8JJH0_CITSI|nr:WAT1-related protein [Citrus sinensis]